MKIFVLALLILAGMEYVAWNVYQNNQARQRNQETPVADSIADAVPVSLASEEAKEFKESDAESEGETLLSISGITEYPVITVEQKGDVTERTIHMGVRQWAWDPSELRVKKGELVRLVIHNADVPHAIVIQGLGVQADIPEEGAVVEFMPKEKGTYDFFCSTYCGEGHMEMWGKIIVEE